MYLGFNNPYVLASVILGGLAGFFIGRMLVSSRVGGAIMTLFGLVALLIVFQFLSNGHVEQAFVWTQNLGDYILMEPPAFFAIIVGLVMGAESQKRRRHECED